MIWTTIAPKPVSQVLLAQSFAMQIISTPRVRRGWKLKRGGSWKPSPARACSARLPDPGVGSPTAQHRPSAPGLTSLLLRNSKQITAPHHAFGEQNAVFAEDDASRRLAICGQGAQRLFSELPRGLIYQRGRTA